MYRKDVNESSPLRILERSIHGGLGPGNLGVVMARAGVGKTAFLVQIGLDDAMRERPVLHIALHQTLEHVQSWYDALFDDLAHVNALSDPAVVRAAVGKYRVIQAYQDEHLTPQKLEEVIDLYRRGLSFAPKAVLIDGFAWEGDVAGNTAALKAFKAVAKKLNAELWMTAQTHRSAIKSAGGHPTQVIPPCADYTALIDVAVFLEPHDHHAEVRLLKDHDNPRPDDTELELHVDKMRLMSGKTRTQSIILKPSAYTLLSGGAKGAEATFGEMAERWGLAEVNYSFAGHKVERTRGLVELNDEELRLGEVSEAYVKAKLHRTFPDTPLFKKVLQSIWHQVATAGQVFVVGEIQADETVKGGTGWGAELARHFHKPLFVFDQEKRGWFTWTTAGKVTDGASRRPVTGPLDKGSWEPVADPTIRRPRFAGTGTRFISDAGREAIEKLFEASFGSAPRR